MKQWTEQNKEFIFLFFLENRKMKKSRNQLMPQKFGLIVMKNMFSLAKSYLKTLQYGKTNSLYFWRDKFVVYNT